MRNVVESLTEHDYRQQFHPELSAAGWHLGHCLYIENYWLHEVLHNNNSLTQGLDQLYIPELSPKPERGGKLPELKKLLEMATQYQNSNLQLLKKLSSDNDGHHLLRENYLQNFIIQHYDQHFETLQMILQQRALKQNYSDYQVSNILVANQPSADCISINAGEYKVGSDQAFSYDNERPHHAVKISAFSIAKSPVTNQQYLAFITDNAYQNKTLWSDQGWQWKQLHSIDSPEHWRQDSQANWFAVDAAGAFDLQATATLSGISYYEACAFAKWSKARLPHEHEWEIAFLSGQLENNANAWQWCQNRFNPYAGFQAFPYDGYSSPWFEQPHYVLKGASPHTQQNITRASFRNFFGPDKRHIFAGCRLVYE